MHFIFSYVLEASETQCNFLDDCLGKVIKDYQNVELFKGTYLVKLKNKSDWEKFRIRLTEITQDNGCDLQFIMSPIIAGGEYDGWLRKNKWDLSLIHI